MQAGSQQFLKKKGDIWTSDSLEIIIIGFPSSKIENYPASEIYRENI